MVAATSRRARATPRGGLTLGLTPRPSGGSAVGGMRVLPSILLAAALFAWPAWSQTDAEIEHPPAATNVPEPPPANETPAAPAPRQRRGPRSDSTARMFSRADDRAERERALAARGRRRRPGEPDVLELQGMPDAWFYRSRVRGRSRVFIYLHSRGADPREACQRFSDIVTRFGWLICPVGPGSRGSGRHVWNNNAALARRYSVAALTELGRRFGRRIRWTDNVIMGFSEGAFVAMQTGLMEPSRFSRWVIFAAHDGYIDMNRELYPDARRSLRKIYLLTGAHDAIVEHTRRANALMRRERLGRVEMRILPNAAHELPPQFDAELRRALRYVTR